MKNIILSTCLLSMGFFSGLQAQNRYVNDSSLNANRVKNEKVQLALCNIHANDGRYYITDIALTEKNNFACFGKKEKAVRFTLVPAAKIVFVKMGKPGLIKDKYTGADGVERPAPTADWNKFNFIGQYDTVQLYYLQKEVTEGAKKMFLTSVKDGKFSFKPAVTDNGMDAFTQMFALQERMGGQVFRTPFYGILFVAPVVACDASGKGIVNHDLGSDNIENALLLNTKATIQGDSSTVASTPTRRNTREFALIRADAKRVTSLQLNKKELELSTKKNETYRATLTATVLPENADNKAVIWTSLDESIAKVSDKGEVTAQKSGTTQIKVSSVDGFMSALCSVTVTGETSNIDPDISTSVIVYSHEGRIYIKSGRKESVRIYSLTGRLLYTGTIEEGTTTIQAGLFPQVFIVKGSSGWTKKISK